MSLRNLSLKDEYRSDRDDIISEFFVPCLSNCVEYDRCIENVSIKSLSTLAMGLDNFAEQKAKIRIITSHRFRASDLDLLSKLLVNHNGGVKFNGRSIREKKIIMLKEFVENQKVEIKVAIPNSEDVAGSFTEKIGIFTDVNGDIVAFTGTSSETFNTQNKNFESIDVFTSWNDKSRVETKIKDFEELWKNKTKYIEVYDYEYAERNNLLKYSSQWALELLE